MGTLRITLGGDPGRWREVIGHPIEVQLFDPRSTITGTIVDVETDQDGNAVVVIEGQAA